MELSFVGLTAAFLETVNAKLSKAKRLAEEYNASRSKGTTEGTSEDASQVHRQLRVGEKSVRVTRKSF